MTSEENLKIGAAMAVALIKHIAANHSTDEEWLQICAGVIGALGGACARQCGVDITLGLIDQVKLAIVAGTTEGKPH